MSDRYSKQRIFLGRGADAGLRAKRVAVLGLGALGSVIAPWLARRLKWTTGSAQCACDPDELPPPPPLPVGVCRRLQAQRTLMRWSAGLL